MKIFLKGSRGDCLGCDQRTLTRMLRGGADKLGDSVTIMGPLIHHPVKDNLSQVKGGVQSKSNKEVIVNFAVAVFLSPSW